MADLLLIHPPVSLPCEPPPGMTLLAGRLRAAGLEVAQVDANVEALHSLLASASEEDADSMAQQRAVRHRDRALRQLRNAEGYENADRYRTAVWTLRQLLRLSCSGKSGRVDLAAYQEPSLSPFRYTDLRTAAESWPRSPFADYFQRLAKRAAALRPRAIGLSLNYLHQALPGAALAGALRAQCGATPIVAGGGLVSCWRGRLDAVALKPAIDRLVFGDGTRPLLSLAGIDDPPPATSRAGPDYEGAPWDHYLAPTRIATLSTSQGCFWNKCKYCPEAAGGRPFSMLHGERLPQVVEEVCRHSEAGLLHLTDSAIPLACLKLLGSRPWPARWYGFTRFHRSLADPSLCRSLRRSGCAMLQLGLESGSPRVLRRLNKGVDLAVASETLRALAGEGVQVYLYVMFGIPGETQEDAQLTLEFVRSHAPWIRFINTSLLNLPLSAAAETDLNLAPYPGDNDLSLYVGFTAQQGWDRRSARHFLEREFARQPEVAAILRRTPSVFQANHGPFFGREGDRN